MGMTRQDTHVRWLLRSDMPIVMAIERMCFNEPYTEDEIVSFLRCRNTIGMVAEINETIVGFMIYDLHKKYIDIQDFAIHPDYQRQGYGTAMIDKLKGKLAWERRTAIHAVTGDANLRGHLFLKACGFYCVEIMRDLYPTQDGYLFRYRITNLDVEACED